MLPKDETVGPSVFSIYIARVSVTGCLLFPFLMPLAATLCSLTPNSLTKPQHYHTWQLPSREISEDSQQIANCRGIRYHTAEWVRETPTPDLRTARA